MQRKWNTGVIRFMALQCKDGWLVEGYINGANPVLSYSEPLEMTVEEVAQKSREVSAQLFVQWLDATKRADIRIT